MALVIRAADVDDLTAVLSVGHRTWPVTYEPIAGADYVAMGPAKWWTEGATLPAIRAGRVTVAEVDGEVVGMATVGPHENHLLSGSLCAARAAGQGHRLGPFRLGRGPGEGRLLADPRDLPRWQQVGRELLPQQGIRRGRPRVRRRGHP